MPVLPLYDANPAVRSGEMIYDGVTYTVVMYINPSGLPRVHKNALVDRLGKRQFKGKTCLGTTKEEAAATLDDGDYSLVAFVGAVGTDDFASGALQYYDFYTPDGEGPPQFWVTDLCRPDNIVPRSIKSPIPPIMKLFDDIARAHGVDAIHLMVAKDPEENKTFLLKKYGEMGYAPTDEQVDEEHVYMKKPLAPADIESIAVQTKGLKITKKV